MSDTTNAAMDAAKEVFKEEAAEHLESLEGYFLELEGDLEDMEMVGNIFRSMHTIKGSGSMFGFNAVASFAHELENVYDLVRNNKMKATTELVEISLDARDHLCQLLETEDIGVSVDLVTGKELVTELRKLIPSEGEKVSETGDFAVPVSDTQAEKTYRIRFRPSLDIFANGTNPLFLLEELRELGSCVIVAQTSDLPALSQLDPESCYTYWNITLTTDQGSDAIEDVFVFIDDQSEVNIEVIDEGDEEEEGKNKRLGELLVERGALTQDQLAETLQQQDHLGNILEKSGLVDSGQINAALEEQKHVQAVRKKRQKKAPEAEAIASIRVSSSKLDIMVDLVGELVTVQARLMAYASQRDDAELTTISESFSHLTSTLRDQTMSIRMLQIGTTFNKFRRLIRDLSKDLGKEVAIIAEGAETELDKTVIERLDDPLVHIIRNSVDHGIESPEDRLALGKPREGTISLVAAHTGTTVTIAISDDGKGMDSEAIRAKAIERGLITADTDISQKQLFELIFEPGFSTAAEVTNVSGRGVGMDVVKKNIMAMRGQIDITSQKGVGSTITIRLPLTLAIIHSLLVTVGKEYFVLPLAAVEECIELTSSDIEHSNGRDFVNVRGEIVPYIHLRKEFSIKRHSSELEQVGITNLEGIRVGFVVDSVVGEHQTVIKSLGHLYKDLEGVSGATILGNGEVALIVDILKLAKRVEVRGLKLWNLQ